jgi:uncharacterized protein YgbK (DUF1537 family)
VWESASDGDISDDAGGDGDGMSTREALALAGGPVASNVASQVTRLAAPATSGAAGVTLTVRSTQAQPTASTSRAALSWVRIVSTACYLLYLLHLDSLLGQWCI